MSVISSFYNTTFSVKRYASVSGTRTDAQAVVSSGNSGVIRPVTERIKLFKEANFGKEYKLWCDNTVNIKANDIILVGSTNYGVEAVTSFADLVGGFEDHLEVIVTKQA